MSEQEDLTERVREEWAEFNAEVRREVHEKGMGILVHLHEFGADTEQSPHVPPGRARYINHTEVADAH